MILSHVKISITVKEKNLNLVDGSRELATRSAFIDYLIEKTLAKKEDI